LHVDVVRRHVALDKSSMLVVTVPVRTLTAVLLLFQLAAIPACADTMEAALLRAYQNNPQLNAQRASVRAVDENVPQALSGYRPRVAMTASGGGQFVNQLTQTSTGKKIEEGLQGPHAAGVTVAQTLFNGNQTANKTRAAESQVLGAREGLRFIEQSVLLAAATVYMDYLRDAALLEVQRSNVHVLEQTLKQTRDRYAAGLVTPTDVAQSEAQLAAGRTQELAAEVQKTWQQTITQIRQFNASAVAQVSVPIYQGGAEYSLIRQSKETLAQQRLNLEQVRDQARADLITAWGQLLAGKAQVSSSLAQVTASEIALIGVRKEASVGQRTTLDVLNQQQALVNARVALVTAQHDRVVASYAVLSTIGRLSPQVLRLATPIYDPGVHYRQVRDNWTGVRTPDGR
jgi:outer membrane protein